MFNSMLVVLGSAYKRGEKMGNKWKQLKSAGHTSYGRDLWTESIEKFMRIKNEMEKFEENSFTMLVLICNQGSSVLKIEQFSTDYKNFRLNSFWELKHLNKN